MIAKGPGVFYNFLGGRGAPPKRDKIFIEMRGMSRQFVGKMFTVVDCIQEQRIAQFDALSMKKNIKISKLSAFT